MQAAGKRACLFGLTPAWPAAVQMGEWQGLLSGFTLGTTHLVFFGAYALALWYGARRVADGAMDGGKASAAPGRHGMRRGRIARDAHGGGLGPATGRRGTLQQPLDTAARACPRCLPQVVTVILSCVMGGFSLGQVGAALAGCCTPPIECKGRADTSAPSPLQAMPHLAVFQQGCTAAATLFDVIERKGGQPGPGTLACPTDAAQNEPPPESCRGDVELAGVCFAYPARPERPIFRGLNLVFPAGGQCCRV